MPRIAVLLATYNGIKWLPQQIDSIMRQQRVDVRLIVSDDMSSDGTWEWLQNVALTDDRIILLQRNGRFGKAAKNFFRLLRDCGPKDFEFYAFSDQDDIWEPDKLIRHAELMRQTQCDGISSNVIAFWNDGRRREIVKAQQQRELDFLFEGPGPGCTFLMSPRLVEWLRSVLADPSMRADDVQLHDWLAYTVCRAMGGSWYIDHVPSILYRQHLSNEFGANAGLGAKLSRLRKLSKGWYRGEVAKLAYIASQLSPDPRYRRLESLLNKGRPIVSRIYLLPFVWQGRRKLSHRLMLAAAIVTGVF